MARLIFRIGLIWALFMFLFPRIKGIEFNGSLPYALGFATPFALMGWAGHRFGRSPESFPARLRWPLIAVVWVVGFWLIPALVLKGIAWLFPTTFRIVGWLPTLWAALLLTAAHVVALVSITRNSAPSRNGAV